ncbi:putative mitochondrial hypothetical protein [Leptomonas pyrrhocoris]|uniref:Uncharacterized protein n=1 Tax=Leptomonas pyrrhocoris TaxID=157538 RepID=A0A0N0E096_LEPPY|nr:putative mitochondrial hypothetical protein [Leptomonas pyrrhocoris]KPA86195.1 putative mitochondrial hypothetical protein [Leptomonas pyrrhocoris]|eukprot:XP_015664634.1 putative mitochondrial hypothetical protein [Leptomonas pyrrhocoris]
MRRQGCQRLRAVDTFAVLARAQYQLSYRAASSATSFSVASSPTSLDSATHAPPPRLHRPRYSGSGACSPALFRPTRIARIPPQLLRFLVASSAALLQVFLVSFHRESRRLKYEAEATVTADGSAGSRRHMSGVEAVQVLGLDRSYPVLFNEIQKAESNKAQSAASASFSPTPLPLRDGRAREEAKRNFERMFALAIKEENLFLAGKLSAAYRVCVDPMWDQSEEVAENQSKASPEDEREKH